jgi:hypothetical protein
MPLFAIFEARSRTRRVCVVNSGVSRGRSMYAPDRGRELCGPDEVAAVHAGRGVGVFWTVGVVGHVCVCNERWPSYYVLYCVFSMSDCVGITRETNLGSRIVVLMNRVLEDGIARWLSRLAHCVIGSVVAHGAVCLSSG